MVPYAPASTPSAPYRQLVAACDTSTLPATTAAGYTGDSMLPSGMRISIGFRQPAFIGISSSTSVRNTYSTTARLTLRGALKLLGRWAEVPVKSTTAERLARSIETLT